jgi:hypothetical protein
MAGGAKVVLVNMRRRGPTRADVTTSNLADRHEPIGTPARAGIA